MATVGIYFCLIFDDLFTYLSYAFCTSVFIDIQPQILAKLYVGLLFHIFYSASSRLFCW